MAISHSNPWVHWNYFLALEEDLIRLARFVEFDESNHDTHSIEIARLFLSTSSEVDVVCKQLCEKVSPGSTSKDIVDYRNTLTGNFPSLPEFKITIPRFGTELRPWQNWQNGKSPDWWTDHNAAKHERHDNFEKANLKNGINSLAGLFVLVLHLYDEDARDGNLYPRPSLFNVGDQHYGGGCTNRYGIGTKYDVPNI